MEIAITKMSQNGQVVIPVEVREDAGIKPSTKFIVFNQGENIWLKQIKKEDLVKETGLFKRIERSEKQIKKGKLVKADTKMSDKEIDVLLTA